MSSIFSWTYLSHPDDAALPAYRRLYFGIRRAILDGRLKPAEKLPASRDLAAQLKISRNTVVNAFDLLMSEGYLTSRIGAGSFVATSLPDQHACPAPDGRQPQAAEPSPRFLRLSQSAQRTLAWQRRYPRFNVTRPFNPATPDFDGFPFDIWARLLRRAWRRPKLALTIPDDPMGLGDLRAEIAAWLRQSRGVNCAASQVMIVSGAQQALDLIARALVDPGDIVATEDPGYEGIRGVLAANGADVRPIPVDDEGLQVARLESGAPARIVVTTPSRNYPLGTTLSLTRRLSLLQWADAQDAWIVEDDYDSDYRYDGPPLSALQGLDQRSRVIYVGTFSRVLFPGIRLGYLVAPPELVPVFRGLRGFADGVPAPTAQAALATFFTDGHFGSHVRRTRLLYGERRAHLRDLITQKAADLLTILPSDGGLHLCTRLKAGLNDIAVQERMVAARLDCRALSSYYHDKSPENLALLPQGLILGFAGWDKIALSQSFDELTTILRRM
ncbi:PLP-dependent aminotransferase family protein [Thalassospira sp.]|uniref:MocR-like pyridoxine biosynthesis transcription factor PdxR n=1 Tax=Thalassospira sp. TaxID=1912094 RepID=UPI0027347CBB|nr:PLP-dependent aminotransferase family protein [Thalassospira sp.]MDP2696791.1 PLP-dependent aminotransferase family protein [Thalassospira sp.]